MLRLTRGWPARWPQYALDVLMGLAAFTVALLELRDAPPVTFHSSCRARAADALADRHQRERRARPGHAAVSGG